MLSILGHTISHTKDGSRFGSSVSVIGIEGRRRKMRAIDADELLKQQYKMGFGQMPVVSVDAIKNVPTLTPPNEPLTLEQLREMKDEPAYLNVFDPLLKSGWHIIKAVTEDKIIFRGWNTVYVPISSLGKCFDLYAYPPAHIDREAWTAEWKEYTGADAGFHYCSKCGQQAFNYENGGEVVEVLSEFCPSCGKAMTPEAWAELEKRMGVRV